MCGETGKPLTRLFPKSSRFSSNLVSFHERGTHAYGRTQGLVVPTCTDCSNAMILGLDHLANNYAKWTADRCFLWWHEDLDLPSPWEAFGEAADPRVSAEVRAAAIDRIAHDGRMAVLEKFQGRIILRYYTHLKAEEVRRSFEAWGRDVCAKDCRWSVSDKYPIESLAFLMSGHQPSNVEYLYRAIIAGETLPKGLTIPVRSLISAERLDVDSTRNRRRLALLRLANESVREFTKGEPMITHLTIDTITRDSLWEVLPQESTMTDREQAAFALGRLLVRAATVQRWNSPRIQASVDDENTRGVMARAPHLGLSRISRYGTRRVSGRGEVSDYAFDGLHKRFNGLAAALPDRFCGAMLPAERLMFNLGRDAQKELHELHWKSCKKKKADKAAA
jgi:hypothetical protein